MITAREIIAHMESMQNEQQREVLMGFFKTGPGEYGEGDEFLGLKVPQTREVVKDVWKGTPLEEVPTLLRSPWHEVRLCGLLILVAKFEAAAKSKLEEDAKATRTRDELLTMYLDHAEQANNWDLVDLSAPKLLGRWIMLPTFLGDATNEHPSIRSNYKRQVIDILANSTNIWRQRMSMVCTWEPSHQGDPSWCLRYAEMHLSHSHDLMQKAVGWMLREMGKQVSMDLLRDFLRQHVTEIPRTALRYAIEKMDEAERRFWLQA